MHVHLCSTGQKEPPQGQRQLLELSPSYMGPKMPKGKKGDQLLSCYPFSLETNKYKQTTVGTIPKVGPNSLLLKPQLLGAGGICVCQMLFLLPFSA